jgi:HrpA-like RNA helicase
LARHLGDPSAAGSSSSSIPVTPSISAEQLPVDDHRESILARIGSAQVSIIVGETGSGKSSRVPVMLLEEPALRAKVIVYQPRRIAARSLCTRVRSMLALSART